MLVRCAKIILGSFGAKIITRGLEVYRINSAPLFPFAKEVDQLSISFTHRLSSSGSVDNGSASNVATNLPSDPDRPRTSPTDQSMRLYSLICKEYVN